YLGALIPDVVPAILNKKSGIKTMDQWMKSKTPLKIGTQCPLCDAFSDNAKLMKEVLGVPMQIVEGYKGTADIKLAVESGELDGGGFEWNNVKLTFRKALDAGDLVLVLMISPKKYPDFPPNVPEMMDLAKTDEARQLINVGVHRMAEIARPFVLPPGTPSERLQILRNAFQETLKDKEFLAEVKEAKFNLDPITGEELSKAVSEIFRTDPANLAKLKQIFLK
ncbi:MAG: hypothetical protein WCO26_02605, partial [Deltaproteobacteria bacterium]